ncbi:MAG TPA: NUDIX hydrolase [Patescibacteria group bacterium]|nr:NUDIX hydrolase [Patescibacteria group bacterium]
MKKSLPSHAKIVPDNATRVFKGVIFDVYQWPLKMFDGSVATFEMLRRPDTVQIIAIKNNEIVMINDEQPDRGVELTFPGGRTDEEDESWLASAQRELLEETGIACKNWRLIAVYQPLPKIEQFVVWFLATDPVDERPQQLDAGEKITIEPLGFDDVRAKIFAKEYPSLNYAMPLFMELKSLDDLLRLPAFQGTETDR